MDDVDAFLASLEALSSPSIAGGIQQATAASSSASNSAIAAPSSRRRAASDQANTAAPQRRPREEVDVHRPGATTEPLPLFSSSRARAHHDDRRRRRTEQHSDNPAATASSSTASVVSGAATATAACAPPAPPMPWCCPRCTFRNEASVGRCAMCELAQPRPTSAVTPAPVSPACPRCTFVNAPGCRTCTMCECRLPLPSLPPTPTTSTTSSTLGANFLTAATARDAHDTKDTHGDSPDVALTSAKTTPQNTSASTAHGPSSSSSPASAAERCCNDDDVEEEVEEASAEESEDDSSAESSVMDTSDEEHTSSGPDRGRTGGQTGMDEEAYRSRELVAFLQNLEAVRFDTLPCAPVPVTMQDNAHLKPFQRQALHWLLSREQLPSHASACGPTAPTSNDASTSHSMNTTTADHAGVPGVDVSATDMHHVRGGVFADYMGLGKTRTLIALCEATRGPHYDRVTGSQIASHATLIVCPTALMAQWASEIRECVSCPSTASPHQSHASWPTASSTSSAPPKVLLYYGSQKRRVTLFQLAQQYDYVITSYQTLCHEPPVDARNAPGKMYMIQWKRIILDEAHVIRNMRTVQSRTCLKLTSVYRWAVTATPVHNSINDLFPLLRFLQVPYFSNLEWWNREIVGFFNRDPKSPRATTALKMLFAALLLRRTPDSVVNGEPILQMPPKQVTTRVLALSKAESAFYHAVKDNAMSKLDEAQSRQARFCQTQLTTFSTAFTMLMRCRQACLHPYIVVAALRRVKLQLAATAPTEASDKTETGEVVAVSPASTRTFTEASLASQKAAAEAEAARQAAAAASALQQAVNDYVDSVLMRKMRSSLTRGDSSFLHDLVDELKQQKLTERECIICLDTLCRPAILPCAHTFCYECIHQALHVTRKCPLCKQPTKPGDVLEVPEELIRPHSTAETMAKGGDSAVPTTASAASTADNSKANLAAAMEAMNASEAVLRDPTQWPLLLSSKTEYLLNAITRTIPSEEKVVVFSHFVTYLVYAQQVLEKNGIRCALYTGALSMRQRDKVLARFRGDDAPTAAAGAETGPRVLLATITTCGVGLNLTCANHCFLMEPTWNPGVEEQALNRVHRIGQTRAVEVTKLIARDTVEEKVEALCQYKKGLSSVCFGGAGGAGGARIRTEDLLNLFKDPTPAATSTDEDDSSSSSSNSTDSSSDDDIDVETISSDSPSDADGETPRRAPHMQGQRRRRGPPRQPRQRRTGPRHAGAGAGPGAGGRPHRESGPQHTSAATPDLPLAASFLSAVASSPLAEAVARHVLAVPSSVSSQAQSGRASGGASPQQRVLEACQRGLSILNRTMRGN